MPTIKTLVTFNGNDGSGPFSDLIIDNAGDLLGTTEGASTVFEIVNTDGNYATTPTTLTTLNGTDGANPLAGVVADSAGDLFGTTLNGGASNEGVVFELAKTSLGYATTPITLISFDGTNGAEPYASLVVDSAGDLFGTTRGGGSDGSGTVFEITKTANGYASAPVTLANFNGANGGDPEGALIENSEGDLFGTTSYDGTNAAGTVFEMVNHGSGNYTLDTLAVLDGADGLGPVAGVVQDSAGDLFGTAEYGGANGDGTVFEIPYINGAYALTPIILASFNGTTGAYPTASLVIDNSGNLFGTTYEGGANQAGTVFEIAKADSGYVGTPITLVSFGGALGANPKANLVEDAAGDLFGTTSEGAAGYGTVFEITPGGSIICFLPGTQIATPQGEVAVDQLAVGNSVLTLSGVPRRIVWIGEGHVLATRGQRNAATPVIVRKHALADNVPHQDLRVTKAHALYIDNVLIPVEFLVNHRTILWDEHAQEVHLYHVELETHDVLLANGAPAESYRDDGNRWLFQNASSGWGLPPQPPCAPVLTGGPIVDSVWRRLLDRAGPRPGIPTTEDPDLHLLVDSDRVDADSLVGESYFFCLTTGSSIVRIVSRTGVPQELGLARDPRCLGVALRHITISQGTATRTMQAEDACLTEGFHEFEADNGIRWTTGDAVVPEHLFEDVTGLLVITLTLGGRTTYVDEGVVQRAA